MTQTFEIREAKIKALIEAWADPVRGHDWSGILAHHEQDLVMFDVPPPSLGAEKSFGDQQATIMRCVGTNVEGGIITGSGHWIMEEQPAQTVNKVRAFLDVK